MLVKDIYPGSADANPSFLTAVDGILLFMANDGTHGTELWRSDGTAPGTVLVKDVNPGPSGALTFPNCLQATNVDGTLFFSADDGTHGPELWRSDGTETGTVIVKDINPGPAGAFNLYCSEAINVNGMLFFSADDGAHGVELWRSNGVETGTVMVKDINPSAAGGYFPGSFINVNGMLFFAADDGTGGELWRSDGSALGTVSLNVWLCSTPASANGLVFFCGEEVNTGCAYGCHLWKSDGTTASPVLPKIFRVEGGDFTKVGHTLFFVAADEAHGLELWKTDGTAAGTMLVKDINSGAEGSYPRSLTAVQDTLFFLTNCALWRSDGTVAGTTLVKDSEASPSGCGTGPLTNVNDTLLFSAYDAAHGEELWRSDGTAAGTALVKNIAADLSGSDPVALTNVHGTLFFSARDATGVSQLWKSDGTEAGTSPIPLVRDPSDLTAVNDALLCREDEHRLWRSDGTAEGTTLLKEFEGSPGYNLFVGHLTRSNGGVFFTAADASHPFALWRSDGTEGGTVVVKPFGFPRPDNLTDVGGTLFFRLESSGLWRSDGTEVGTKLVKDLQGHLGNFTNVNGTLFFTLLSDMRQAELWKSSGTETGTVVVKSIGPYNPDRPSLNFTSVRSRLFFTHADETHGLELWTSDGSAAGTLLVKDLNPGSADSAPANLTDVDGMLFFGASDEVHGHELWQSDGTEAGTVLVRDIMPGPDGSDPTFLTAVQGRLVFQACDAAGCEVWESDGTESGTRQLADVNPGPDSSSPGPFVAAGSRLFFPAYNPLVGQELWAIPLATITVNSAADNTTAGDGHCTLREAIANVNAAGETTRGDCTAGTSTDNTIVFDLTLPATITLTTTTHLVISRDLTIRGPGTGALVIDGNGGRGVLDITAGTVRIVDLAIQDGRGSGILVNGAASVVLTNCAVRGNSGDGGGLYIAAGGTATLSNTTVSNNTDGNNGEGIYISAGGTATLTNCTLSGNGPSGGGGEGGGLYVAAGATATLTNCTLSGNYNVGGAALANFGTVTLTNCTLSDNRVNGSDGALASFGTTTLTNTIVANTVNGANCSGTTVSMGHNLDSDGTCTLSSPGDLSAMDPKLGPLQDNGGPTLTHALLPGSPAIDAGDDAVTGPPLTLTTDQRGLPRQARLHVDIGAVESSATSCAGDCHSDGMVTVDELVLMVNIALGNALLSGCESGDGNHDSKITVDELVASVHNALDGCP
jgi:CSLREA domain-containing protein